MSLYHITPWHQLKHLRNLIGQNSKKLWELWLWVSYLKKNSVQGGIYGPMDPCEFTKSSCHSWELMLTGRTHSATTNRGTIADWQRLYTECDVFYYGLECLHLDNNGSHCLSWKSLHCTCGPFLICNECIMDLIVFVWFWMPSFSNYLGGHCIALAGLFSFATIVYWI